MNQATFSIPFSEFNPTVIARIKAIIGDTGRDFDVFIRLKAKETSLETKQRIEESMREIERGENLISFTPDEYERLIKQLSKP